MDARPRRVARALAGAVLLAAALVAAGLVRPRPAGGDGPARPLDIAPLLAGLEVVGLVIAVVVLAVLAGCLVWVLRTGEAPPRVSQARGLLARVVRLVVVVQLVAVVATIVVPRLLAQEVATGVDGTDTTAAVDADGLASSLWPLAAVLTAVVLALLVVWLLRVEDDPGDASPGRSVRLAAAHAVERLDRGEAVGDVVIEAYLTMERRLAAAGVERRLAETPAELLVRAARLVDVDVDAARTLAAVYERVRFGGRPAAPVDRRTARRALAALGAPAPRTSAARP